MSYSVGEGQATATADVAKEASAAAPKHSLHSHPDAGEHVDARPKPHQEERREDNPHAERPFGHVFPHHGAAGISVSLAVLVSSEREAALARFV